MIDRFQTPGQSLRFPWFSPTSCVQHISCSLGWIAIARDDIRDMMGISIHRINNYMIVATLILSVAAGALLSVSLQPRVSWFHCLRFLPLHWDLLDVLDGVNHVWCERAELGFHQHHEALDLPGIGGTWGT